MYSTLQRVVLALYLAALALLPWSWFPPFPWLHEHAQWSDAVFAATAVAWAAERMKRREWPRLGPAHAAMAAYLVFAFFSLAFAARGSSTGALKFLGMAELCLLAVITSDITRRDYARRAVARVVAASSLVIAAAAITGLILFYAGVSTRLIGTYGDLIASGHYARAEAGFYQPNLLASFCIFAVAIITRADARLPAWLRRAALAALTVTVALTLSRAILGFGLAVLMRYAGGRTGRAFVALYAAACVVIIFALSFWNLSLDPSRPFDMHFSAEASSRNQGTGSSLETLVHSPVWGVGVGSSPGQYRGAPFDAHLTPVNIAATLGLPALIAFTSLPVVLWRRSRRPLDLALWGGLAGLGLDALAQDVEDFRHVWVMMGLAAADSAADREGE